MERVEKFLVSADRWQRSDRCAGLIYGVVKKYGDDDANQYAVALGWYGFVAIYPLLLVAITVLSFVGAASLGHHLVSTLHQFPVVGASSTPLTRAVSMEAVWAWPSVSSG